MSLDPREQHKRQAAEDLYRIGRSFVRSGDKTGARQRLAQAVQYDPTHSEAWMWLAATYDDPQEQRRCLEEAVAANPYNAGARRGLAIVTGKLNPKDIPSQPEAPTLSNLPPLATTRRTFDCPQCGGRLAFDPELIDLKCVNCGFVEVVEEVALKGDGAVLDFTLPTRRGQGKVRHERYLKCEQCNAITLLPIGKQSSVCAFCDSPALVAAPEDAVLLEPHGVVPMRITADKVKGLVKQWLGTGFFAPDDLALFAKGQRLHPAYAPFWAFSATANVRWSCEIAEGYGRSRRWTWRKGEHTFFYTDLVVPAARAIASDLAERVPYDLAQVVEYKIEYLADWPATTYDTSLADASLKAREQMLKDARKELLYKAAPGRDIRNLQVGGGEFSGQTYKLLLLPVWVGNYQYQGAPYRLFINGQTGKVAGDKPIDRVKVVLVVVAALLALVFGLVLLYLLFGRG